MNPKQLLVLPSVEWLTCHTTLAHFQKGTPATSVSRLQWGDASRSLVSLSEVIHLRLPGSTCSKGKPATLVSHLHRVTLPFSSKLGRGRVGDFPKFLSVRCGKRPPPTPNRVLHSIAALAGYFYLSIVP
jgi:hypothetical protein